MNKGPGSAPQLLAAWGDAGDECELADLDLDGAVSNIANLAIPGNRPYCDECGYDLTRAGAAACPECGTPRADSAPTGAAHAASSTGAAADPRRAPDDDA